MRDLQKEKALLIEKIKKNECLNGNLDIRDGDPFSALENFEIITKEITYVKTVKELWRNLINYSGSFNYDNLYFVNHPNSGCFVYVFENDKMLFIDHLTISAFTFERFCVWLLEKKEMLRNGN